MATQEELIDTTGIKLKDIPGITSAPDMPSEVAGKAIEDTTRAYAFPLMAILQALAPSAATVGTATKATAGVAVVLAMASCSEDEPTPKDPNAIDRTTDNPKHKAEYMADVKPITLGGGVATLDFEAEWVPTLKEYQLQPKSMVDFAKAAQKLEEYAAASNRNVGELAFALYYRSESGVRIAWKIPYSLLKELNGLKNLNDDAFDQYRVVSDVIPDGGNPDANVSKGAQGYLSLDIGESNGTKVLKRYIEISPYYFGKTQ